MILTIVYLYTDVSGDCLIRVGQIKKKKIVGGFA